MELTILPPTGQVYIDVNSLIYNVEQVEAYRTQFESMWQQARSGEFDVAAVKSRCWKPLSSRYERATMLW